MSDNQKKLNEQLVKVVLDTKTCDEVRIKRAKYLIRLGANVNQKVNGKSLLKIAREKGYKEVENVIKESLRKSFDELLDGDKFERVLDECGYANGHKVVVSKQKAIDLGKKFWNRNGDLKSAKEIEDLIQQGADVDVQVNKDKTALMIASYFGREDVVRILLGAGADVNIKGDDGWTALMIAVESGHKEIVEMLLDRGADVNQKNEHSTTALMIASYWGREDVVGILLEGGADVHQKDNDGETALMNASEKGYKGVVEMLLQNGADVHQKDNDGETALMKATYKGSNDIVQMLLEKGADVHQKNNDGRTALMKATDKETKKVIKEHIKKTGGEPTNGGFLGKIFDGFGR